MDPNAISLEDLAEAISQSGLVRRLLELARDEDHGETGDITSQVAIPAHERNEFRVVARQAGVVAGLGPLTDIVSLGESLRIQVLVEDGARIVPGTEVAALTGLTREILGIERIYLNLLGRLSGIATRTRTFVETMGTGHRAHLLDTRKTTPGMRVLEKYAVRCGGGRCHRFGLFDALLLKDNHIAHVPIGELAAFVTDASRKARQIWSNGAVPLLRPFVEVEVDTLEQFAEILRVEPGLVEIVLLDNMGTETLKRAVEMRDHAGSSIELEASGGVTIETIRSIAQTGVERISVGSITHGATVLDFGLDAV
jgi:nicotinate-nucleotide pyrophosphorylase (carboxylating)